MSNWRISKEQYNQLLHYIGCGDILNADIIVFGNEEGTGGYSVEANVEGRIRYFGRDENGNFKYSLNGLDWKGGYWQPSALGGRDHIVRYLREKGENPKVKDFVRGGFLQTTARITLALENRQAPIDYWFKKFPDNKEAEKKIKSHIINNLFQPLSVGIQTALVDWRPLPRPNMSWWGDEYSIIDRKKYDNAFDQPFKNNTPIKDNFFDYVADVQKRKDILLSAFTHSKAKIIIGLGGVIYKKEILGQIFNGITFQPLEIESVKTNLTSVYATIQLGEKQLSIFLLPFPAAGNVFRDGNTQLSFFREFVEKYLLEKVQNHEK